MSPFQKLFPFWEPLTLLIQRDLYLWFFLKNRSNEIHIRRGLPVVVFIRHLKFGNTTSLSTLLQAKDADCTRARRDDCCKVLVFNSVGNVFYDLLSISGMPPPHLATNSHILSLVPIPKYSSTEQQAVLSSMTRAVFQDHKVPLGRCSQLELLSCHSLITTVVKQDCWAGNE